MLITRKLFLVCILAMACFMPAAWMPHAIAQQKFTLARVIPNDVFLFATSRENPERKFLEDYWCDVFDALKESGIDEDLAELFRNSFELGDVQADEIVRISERFKALISEVQWKQLAGSENVFAERFTPFDQVRDDQPTVVAASMVWLCHGSVESTKHNFEALVAILDAVAEEANNALDREALTVNKTTPMGAQLASVNLLGAVPGEPLLPLSVAMRKDMLMIAFREDLRDDVLSIINGDGSKKTLADDSRFQKAFSDLPAAEDSMVFFDAQALLNPMRTSLDSVFHVVANPRDQYRNTGIDAAASEINVKALKAYHQGNIEEALKLVQQAHEIEPKDAIVLYNLACFNALLNKQDAALDWLEKAVDGGFYAPHKISTDADLKTLRNDPRYKRALAKAAELAADTSAEDVAIHFTDKGEVRRLQMQMQQAYEKQDYDQALEFIEQAYALAPQDSKVLYSMGSLHALKGHKDKGLDFLQKAVDSGFYCPKQISKDPDWESIREDPRFQELVIKAEKKASDAASGGRQAKLRFVKHLLDRQLDAVGVIDYAATVESTDGHSVWSESVTVLVPDAEDRAIYPILSQRQPVADFAKYLPRETAAFSISGGVNMRELYKFAEDTFRGGGPLGEEILAKWEEVQQKFGLDVQQDVFGLIEGDSINITLADGGGSVAMAKVADEAKAYQKIDEAMSALPQMLTEAISQQPALGGLAAMVVRCSPLQHESLERFQQINIAMSPTPIGVWGTADGFLIFGSSAEAVALCLATGRNEHPNIHENANVISEVIVPTGPFVSVSLADHRSSSKDIATAMGAASMMGGMVAASIPKPELRPLVVKMTSIMGKLGPVIQKVDFYESVATATTFDGKAYRSRCVTHYQSPSDRPQEELHQEAVAE